MLLSIINMGFFSTCKILCIHVSDLKIKYVLHSLLHLLKDEKKSCGESQTGIWKCRTQYSARGKTMNIIIGLDKQKCSTLNCKYFLTHNF